MKELCHDLRTDLENTVPRAIAHEILNNLYTQKASGQFCDVQFLHETAIVWAHSCVLASYSPFMMRLFHKYAEENKSWSFNKPIQVNISSVTKCNGTSKNNCIICTCKIIDFIYTGKIKLDPDHLDHVVNLSNNLEIDILLLICQRYKRDHITLLDSLSESNQISAGACCDEIIDAQAYVDNLNYNVSNNSYLQATNDIQNIEDTSLIDYLENIKTGSDDISSVLNKDSKLLDNTDENRLNQVKNKEISSKLGRAYVCTACNFKSRDTFSLKQHKRVFHKRHYICLVCDYVSFKMGDVIEHLLKSEHGGTTCSVCLFEAVNTIELKNHLHEHSRTFPFKCSMCKQRFKYRNEWVRHKYSPFHEKELLQSIEKLTIVPQKEEKQNFACRICKYEFPNEILLQKHNHIFHKRKYICLSCEFNTFKIDSIIEHLDGAEHEENVCSICLYVSSDIKSFKTHLLDHKHPQPFSCTICSSRYQTRNEWWRHVLTHGTDKPFKCQYCTLSFQTSSYLKTHILYTHKKKMHTCKICGYGAPFASKLQKHSLIHKNKFKCKVHNCTFNCNSEALLEKHRKEHGNILKLVSCPLCSLTFKFGKNVKRHIKIVHKANNFTLTCPICNYTDDGLDKMKEHCKNMHVDDNAALEIINKQYEAIQTYEIPKTIKKPRRSQPQTDQETLTTINSSTTNNIDKVSEEKQLENLIDSTKNNENHYVNTTIADPLNQTVLLSEATGELNILCENEGKPIPVASVTSTNVLTIGNFREGTGSVTLNEMTGVLTLNNINVDSKGAVFLNESTGVLSYINLNIADNPQEVNSNINENNDIRSEQIQLNEVTGEIVTIKEDIVTNKSLNSTTNVEEDFQFDNFGIDFNEDSCDGFDDFDSIFFDAFSSSFDATNINSVLKNNNTDELFSNCEHLPRLDEMTGEFTFDKDTLQTSQDNLWTSVNTFPDDTIMQSVTNDVYESLLNEVTGEFS